jgi:hypothetical protein
LYFAGSSFFFLFFNIIYLHSFGFYLKLVRTQAYKLLAEFASKEEMAISMTEPEMLEMFDSVFADNPQLVELGEPCPCCGGYHSDRESDDMDDKGPYARRIRQRERLHAKAEEKKQAKLCGPKVDITPEERSRLEREALQRAQELINEEELATKKQNRKKLKKKKKQAEKKKKMSPNDTDEVPRRSRFAVKEEESQTDDSNDEDDEDEEPVQLQKQSQSHKTGTTQPATMRVVKPPASSLSSIVKALEEMGFDSELALEAAQERESLDQALEYALNRANSFSSSKQPGAAIVTTTKVPTQPKEVSKDVSTQLQQVQKLPAPVFSTTQELFDATNSILKSFLDEEGFVNPSKLTDHPKIAPLLKQCLGVTGMKLGDFLKSQPGLEVFHPVPGKATIAVRRATSQGSLTYLQNTDKPATLSLPTTTAVATTTTTIQSIVSTSLPAHQSPITSMTATMKETKGKLKRADSALTLSARSDLEQLLMNEGCVLSCEVIDRLPTVKECLRICDLKLKDYLQSYPELEMFYPVPGKQHTAVRLAGTQTLPQPKTQRQSPSLPNFSPTQSHPVPLSTVLQPVTAKESDISSRVHAGLSELDKALNQAHEAVRTHNAHLLLDIIRRYPAVIIHGDTVRNFFIVCLLTQKN